ncbi:MAG: hypothetical protein J6S60_09230 [Oscillospiraceae bacterium]|nr:hypothetical protein [Oscillospiraceae bacterium]
MSKYRITIENIGEGADWDGHDIECDGFLVLGDQGEKFDTSIQDLNIMDMAKMIAHHVKLRGAARISLAMHEALMEDKAAANPLAAILSSVRPIREDD